MIKNTTTMTIAKIFYVLCFIIIIFTVAIIIVKDTMMTRMLQW